MLDEIYQKMASRFEDNDGIYLPQILALMVTPEEAALCVEMPDTIENLARKTGRTEEETLEMVKECTRKGIVHYGHGSRQAYQVKYIVTLSDYGVANPNYDKTRGPQFFQMLKKLRTSDEYLKEFGKQIEEDGQGAPMFRIVPRWESIKHIPGVMPCENMHEILREHDGHISSVRCICRTTMQDPDCPVKEGPVPEKGHCIKFDEVAEHYVENMGVGSYISAAEVQKLFETDSEMPFYHMLCNTREIKGGFCNCCGCCCDMRWGLKATGNLKAGIAPSRFLAVTRSEKCKGCRKCISNCQFQAISYDEDKKCVQIDPEKCMGCGVCVVGCKADAIKMKLIRKPEHIPVGGPQHILESLKSLEL